MTHQNNDRRFWIPLLIVIWAGAGWLLGNKVSSTRADAASFGLVIGGLVGLFWGAIFFILGKRKNL